MRLAGVDDSALQKSTLDAEQLDALHAFREAEREYTSSTRWTFALDALLLEQ